MSEPVIAAAGGPTRHLTVDRRGIVRRTLTVNGRRVSTYRIGYVYQQFDQRGRNGTWRALLDGGRAVCDGARTRREALAAMAEVVL